MLNQLRRMIGVALTVVALIGSQPVMHGQTAATGRMMREKLAHAQALLEALTTSNYGMLDRESTALSRLTETPRWRDQLKTPEFKGFSDNFQKAVTDLNAAAKARDLDTAATLYSSMVTTCYQCHRHVKDARVAR